MRLLVLGGTVFLGRHLVDLASARGHAVTLFNRGRSGPDLFPDVEQIHGDRDGGLNALRGRSWDAVVDTSGYVPRVVRAAAEILAPTTEHYTFVSTLSVYEDWSAEPLDETAAVGRLEDELTEDVTGASYGPLKALCEAAVERAFPGRAFIVRPGLIVGPCDPSDRFTYWPARVAEGGEVLAPGRPERTVQFVDVRDLAAWILDMAERGAAGIFNATGPEEPLTMQGLLDECIAVLRSAAVLTWVTESFLLERGVAPWTELPLWIPNADDHFDCRKAIAAGLRFRPLAETVRDTLEWDAARPAERPRRAGLSREREREILAAWSAVKGSEAQRT